MENCASPAIVTKDLAMLVYGRDGRLGPRLKHLFQGTFRNPEANRLTGIYEIVLKKASIGSPGESQNSVFFKEKAFRLSDPTKGQRPPQRAFHKETFENSTIRGLQINF